MDPLTLATTFATLVGLIGQYKSEGENREAKTLDEYLEWLRRVNHHELATLIKNNSALSEAITVLLGRQHDEVMSKLATLDATLSSVAQQFPDFREMAIAVRPESVLSDQAVSVLRQLNAAKASRFLEVSLLRSGRTYHIMDGERGDVAFPDERFIEDDLTTLCDLGLLRLDYNNSGDRLFHITRNGATVGG